MRSRLSAVELCSCAASRLAFTSLSEPILLGFRLTSSPDAETGAHPVAILAPKTIAADRGWGRWRAEPQTRAIEATGRSL